MYAVAAALEARLHAAWGSTLLANAPTLGTTTKEA